jgi:hypothetical protein
MIFNETELIEHLPTTAAREVTSAAPPPIIPEILKPRFAPSSAIRGLCGVQLDASDVHLIQTKSRSQSEAVEQIVAIVPFGQIAEGNPVAGSTHLIGPPKPACPKASGELACRCSAKRSDVSIVGASISVLFSK